MRNKVLMLLAAASPLAASGCNLAYYASHNLVNEPITRADEHKLSARLKTESRNVWREICMQFPARTFTPEFADGFTDGYADHLENGGPPGPPVVPPLRYRRANYLTVEGHALIRDYMIGFQYGAELAVATGKRNFLTVPVLYKDAPPDSVLNVIRYPAPPATSTDGSTAPPSTTPPSTGTALPQPKVVEPPNDKPNPEPKPLLPIGPPEGVLPKLDLPKIGPGSSQLPTPTIPMPEIPKPAVPAVPVSLPTPRPASTPVVPTVPAGAAPIVDIKVIPSGGMEPIPRMNIPPIHEPPPLRPPAPIPNER